MNMTKNARQKRYQKYKQLLKNADSLTKQQINNFLKLKNQVRQDMYYLIQCAKVK